MHIQSINAVESVNLRDLFLYMCPELHDKDIPHRTKMASLILERFKTEYTTLIQRLEVGFSFYDITIFN